MAHVTSILQSNDGLIYLGTDGAGIVKYDGRQFEEISQSGIDNDHHVSSLIENNETVYFSSKYKGLFSLNGNELKQLLKSSLSLGEFYQIIIIGQKTFFVTSIGFFLIENNSAKKLFKFPNYTNEFKINNCITLEKGAILLTNQGNYYVSSNLERVIPLNNWLHISKQAASFINFGYKENDKIHFYDKKCHQKIELILNESEGIYKLNFLTENSTFQENEEIVSLNFNPISKKLVALSNLNKVFQFSNYKFRQIPHNFTASLEMPIGIMADLNGNIWVNSSIKGLYKISLEPFTKMQIHPLYLSTSIMTIFKSKNGTIIISTMDDGTSIGKNHQSETAFVSFDFKTSCIAEQDGLIYMGTKTGIKVYNSITQKFIDSKLPYFDQKQITMLYSDGINLWIGVAGEGLSRYHLINKSIEHYGVSKEFKCYFYTAQVNSSYDRVYYGTNNGLMYYDYDLNKLVKVKTEKSIGSYLGVSTKDIHGTLWFTGEKGLVGILKNGKTTTISDLKYFSSTLFYTLNSDKYSNLIIGTNKGLNILEVDAKGKVLKYRWYQGKTGFDGYETHMRSQFQDNNNIFVGTIEGLYLINTNVLNSISSPQKPLIQLELINQSNEAENSFNFTFLLNNAKINNVLYSYRIKGYKNQWTAYNNKDELLLENLPNGNFTLEVRASYDGKHSSEIARVDFSVDLPFWKTRWFIFLLLFVLVSVNIFFISKNRSLSSGKLFNTNDESIILQMTPQAILFGLITDTATNLIGPYINSELFCNLELTMFVGLVLLALFLLSHSAKSNERSQRYKYLIVIAFSVILLHNFISLYLSKIHPFYLIAVILVYSTAPFIFNRIKTILLFTFVYIIIACGVVLFVQHPIYSKALFLIAIVISAVIAVFSMYLRFDSIEKLLFISGVINKGDIIAISFNAEGTITYASENISSIIESTHEQAIGKHISFLNNYLPEEGSYRGVDLTDNFEDGKKYLTPMLSVKNELQWIEWSCKIFNENVRVILGNNVSERIQLENTYELLVQNAEDLIYQCDVNGDYQFLNQRCFEKLGYTQSEMIGKNSMDLIPENHKNNVNDFYKEHFKQRKESSYLEFPIETSDGTIIWLGQYVTTLYRPGFKNKITGFLALARDITQKREQQETIKEQRDDITSSINYAKKIQLNLLPTKDKFNENFEETCIIYKPKDIVSGDFYWMEKIDDLIVFALSDCTGHGVPGSFMTLLGINLLNNIVLEKRILHPSNILDELDIRLMTALPRENGEENMNDGMEITICVFNPTTCELSYACAGSRFLIYDNNAFTMHKGDSKHIGDKATHGFKNYITHYTKFTHTSTLYLFTDGFQDQFGGIKNKKYSFRRMLELFESNIRLPLSEQEIMIKSEFDSWKLDETQTDDVTIVVLRNPKHQ